MSRREMVRWTVGAFPLAGVVGYGLRNPGSTEAHNKNEIYWEKIKRKNKEIYAQIANDYSLEPKQVLDVLNNLRPGDASNLTNKNGELIKIFRDKGPNENGNYPIRVGKNFGEQKNLI